MFFGSQLLVLHLEPGCGTKGTQQSIGAFPLCDDVRKYGPEQRFLNMVLHQNHLDSLFKNIDCFSSVSPCDYDSVFLGRCQVIFGKPFKICSDGIVNAKRCYSTSLVISSFFAVDSDTCVGRLEKVRFDCFFVCFLSFCLK